MEDNSRNQNNRMSNLASSSSAEEKLKRSMRGLSHMSGGMGSGILDSSSVSSSRKSKEKVERKKVGGVVLDIDTIEGATKQSFDTGGGRKNIIIIVLSLLLVVSLVFLAISIMAYKKSKKKPNLKYIVEGSAEWVIEGGNITKIVLPSGLARDMVYMIDTDLKINTTDSVNVLIEIEVLLDGAPILIGGLDTDETKWLRVEGTNNYEYFEPIVGGGILQVFDGLDFSDAPSNLSSNNVKINIKAIITNN